MQDKFDERAIGLACGVFQVWVCCAVALGSGSCFSRAAMDEDSTDISRARSSIPWSQIGAKAGAEYRGDGLAICPTAEGARLLCVFQRLEGEAAREGLWLTSTVTNAVNDRFRVVALAVERKAPSVERGALKRQSLTPSPHTRSSDAPRLPNIGTVAIDGQSVRLTRPGLVEEYSVSMDGIRQDFVLMERPSGTGELQVQLAVSGARVEPVADGACLVLNGSGRKIAYRRLRATDAAGKELNARMEVLEGARRSRRLNAAETAGAGETLEAAEQTTLKRPEGRAPTLAVLVNDAEAVYPVRIDPTFSDANWVSMNTSIPEPDSSVYAAAVDGLGNLYIGGSFKVVGDLVANYIAKWDGSSWTALGSGMGGGAGYPFVYALAVSGSDVYAGGVFTMATNSGGVAIAVNRIAKWNGSTWSALGSGMNDWVGVLAVSGGDLYAGGGFTTADGIVTKSVAKWNGSSWSALGSGMGGGGPFDTNVQALAVSGSDLYAGGNFTTAGGIAASHVAKWNGSSWLALGSGINGDVRALALSGNNVYAGGRFTMAGGRSASYVATWNGTDWSPLSSGLSDEVYALAVLGFDLYAGGSFTPTDGVTPNYLAKWNGSSWSAAGFASYAGVRTLATSGNDLYVGGSFSTGGGTPPHYIAKLSGSSWAALGSGVGAQVKALAVSNSDVYAGGAFRREGGSAGNCIAKWDGSQWSGLGSGMNDTVQALAVSGSNVYAGGYFTNAGGNQANYVAKWDGSNWSALGPGLSGPGLPAVYALAVSGADVYAGGYFTTAGAGPATNIAKWNGSNWSALGPGLAGGFQGVIAVYALAVSGSNLYAGGSFTMAGETETVYIARWDGTTWSALGSGMDGYITPFYGFPQVSALAVSQGNLYAGGNFTMAGGSRANGIARWNGASWSALGSGMNNPVYALAVSGSDVYAGGVFTTAGGVAASYIAKWNGSSWSTLGSGMSYHIYALAVSGSDLYVGGRFTTAGGKISPNAAHAYLERPTLSILHSGGDVTLSWPVFYEGFGLQQNPDAANTNSWSNANYPLTTDAATKSATVPIASSNQFFRLIGN